MTTLRSIINRLILTCLSLSLSLSLSAQYSFWKTIGESSDDGVTSMTLDSNGDLYIGGFTNSTTLGTKEALVGKIDACGSQIWDRVSGTSTHEQTSEIIVGYNGMLGVAGFTDATSTNLTESFHYGVNLSSGSVSGAEDFLWAN